MGPVGKVLLWTGVLVAVAGTPLGGGARESEVLQLLALRQQVALLSGKVADLRQELNRVPDPEETAYQRGVALGIASVFASARTGLTPEAERRAVTALVLEADSQHLDPWLVAGVIAVESGFHNFAVSPVGAVGLMQVMPDTGACCAASIGLPPTTREELFDPVRNVQFGVRYLAELVRRFGRIDHALVAYNAGPGRAQVVLKGPEAARYLAAYPRKVLLTQQRIQPERSITR